MPPPSKAAYRDFAAHRQQIAKTLDAPDTIDALFHYADICATHLSLPKEAHQAYQTLLGLSQASPEQKKTAQAQLQQAAQMMAAALKPKPSETSQQSPNPTESAKPSSPPRPDVPRPDVPLQQRLKLVQERSESAKTPLKSVAPISTKQTTSAPNGIDVGRGSDSLILFQDIYAIFIAQLPEAQDEVKARKQGTNTLSQRLVADIFMGGQPRPYRLRSDTITYPQFLPNVQQNSIKNFHQFLLRVIQHIDAVYIDQGTFDFLKTGTIPQYPDQDAVEKHERNVWQQLVGQVRFHCAQCWEIYWVERSRIPEKGATTKCAKCGSTIFVKRDI